MVMMKMKQQPLAMWLKRQQAPRMAQVQDGQMPWQKCSTKRFPRISPPSWPRIKPWRRREKEKNKRGKKWRWGWEKDAVFPVQWLSDGLHAIWSQSILSNICWGCLSILSLSFMVILISLIFFYFPNMLCKVFSLTASSGSSGRLNFGSRSVPVFQLKVFSFLRGWKQLLWAWFF